MVEFPTHDLKVWVRTPYGPRVVPLSKSLFFNGYRLRLGRYEACCAVVYWRHSPCNIIKLNILTQPLVKRSRAPINALKSVSTNLPLPYMVYLHTCSNFVCLFVYLCKIMSIRILGFVDLEIHLRKINYIKTFFGNSRVSLNSENYFVRFYADNCVPYSVISLMYF